MFPSSSSSCFTASMFNNSPADHASFSQQDPTLLVPHHHQDNFCNNNNNNNGFFNLITNQPTSSSTLLFPNTTTVVPGTPLPPPKPKKKRSLPGNPDPEAEVIALSPKTLLATNRFVCEICKKGFQRDQNLQLHRRGHNLPWKLKQRNPNNKEEPIKKKAYVCPEPSCVHHHPSRALGDLTGIKKHYCRKHGEKKWKCEKCSKIYAVHSDWKAHSKTCGTREYRCDCGTLFSRDISSDEIKQAVFGMGGGKAPGPDGFSGTFFQKYWKIVETDFCGEIKKFFNTGLMPEGWNDTYITLIPKILKPENFSQFRPISCCNYKYKVISKIMSTRLKKWMPTLINELQSAFTGGRAIQDNIIIVHEVLHNFKNRRTKLNWDMLLKMDMKKAYDMVDWNALDDILKAMGFCDKWRGWVNECIRTVKFAVLVNGEPTGQFSPTRGIRQGDPLSPLLFVLMTNSLSFLIHNNLGKGILKGIKLNRRCPTLTHVLFADDTILFGQASVREATTVINIIQDYGRLTGQMLNHSKSAVTFSNNTPDALQTRVREVLGFPITQGIDKYLGIPSEWGRSKKDVFAYLLERMDSLGQAWKSLMLSHGGKETMLKSVFQSIPTYVMSCFLLPHKMTKKMNTKLRTFFWGGSMNKRCIHWKNGTWLSKPKTEGGLGFKDFRMFNLALLAKQGWRILNGEDMLWVKLLKALYFPNSNFMDAKKGGNPSWIWSSLCDAREVLQCGAMKNLGNGRDIDIQHDPWIPSLPTFRLAPRQREQVRAYEWIMENEQCWNVDMMSSQVSQVELNAIRQIPIGNPNQNDRWVWFPSPQGKFSVKSAYHCLRKRREIQTNPTNQNHIPQDLWKWLWSLSLPPKIIFFLWKMVHNALATKRNLMARKCSTNSTCPVCEHAEEDIVHCLFACRHSESNWTERLQGIALPTALENVGMWLNMFRQNASRETIMTFMATCWCLWRERNECVFRQKKPSIVRTRNQIDKLIEEWRSIRTDQAVSIRAIPLNTTLHTSLPPNQYQQEILCDGSYIENDPVAAFGVIVKDSQGRVCNGLSGQVLCSSPIMAEAKALLTALEFAEDSGLRTIIKSDCLILVQAITGRIETWPWHCYAWIGRMKDILARSDFLSCSFIPRRLNHQADWVAKACRTGSLPVDWFLNLM